MHLLPENGICTACKNSNTKNVTPNIKYVESQILKEEITQTNMVKILTI